MVLSEHIKAKFPNETIKKRNSLETLFRDRYKNYSCRAFLNWAKYNKTINIKNVKKFIEFSKLPKSVGLIYNEDYIACRNNISLSKAKKEIEKYKKDKATSKAGFIKRHGEEIGNKKFQKFQKTSKKSSDKIKKECGSRYKYIQYHKRNSRRCWQFYRHRNPDLKIAQAKALAPKYQLENSGVHKEYYRKKNFSEEEISSILKDIHKKCANNNRNKKFLQKKYGENWQKEYRKASAKYRKRMEKLGIWTELEKLQEYFKYNRMCWVYTREVEHLVKNIHLRSKDWHLDHKFSIKQGFLEGIDAKVIGSLPNLEIISRTQNCSKRAKCSISKKELLKEYENQKNNKN